jgi:tetratricopeptide (TPR) repeat protein
MDERLGVREASSPRRRDVRSSMPDLATSVPPAAGADAAAIVAACRELARSGQVVTAHRRLAQAGWLDQPLAHGAEVALVVGGVLRGTGAPRRARWLALRTWRRHRRDAQAAIRCAFELGDPGALAALDFMDGIGDDVVAAWSAEARADWACARALHLAALRDFATAERVWRAAEALHVDELTWFVRAAIDRARDRTDAALEAVERARAAAPGHVLAIELGAELLTRARRFDEARALLLDAAARTESGSVRFALAARHREAGALDDALACVEAAAAAMPGMERDVHDRIVRTLGYVHHLRGDDARAAYWLRRGGDDAAAARLERADASDVRARRVVLAVPCVPQHHQTCVPATLTSLAEFHGAAADHVEIAEQICHDGTTRFSERRWVEANGFAARELTLTWDVAVALIDAGLPFSLTTVFPLAGHAQAIAGYDARWRTLVSRDPSSTTLVELEWDALERSQQAFGLRAMVIAPAARRAELAALALPDAALHDALHAVEAALEAHDRPAAAAACAGLVAEAPDHPLAWAARRALADYDGDARALAELAAERVARFPDSLAARAQQLGALRDVGTLAEQRAVVEGLLAEAAAYPPIAAVCAVALAQDAADEARAAALARRAARVTPPPALALRLLSSLTWMRGDRRRAATLARYASCLAIGDDAAAVAYAQLAALTGDGADAIDHLEARVAALAAAPAAAVAALCDALDAAGRPGDAAAALARARASRPDDGALHLLAVQRARLAGDLDGAAAALAAARGRSHAGVWRASAAELALCRGAFDEALASWREQVEAMPLDVDSQRAHARERVRRGEVAAATAHLRAVVAAHPNHRGLGDLWLEHLSAHDAGAYEAALADELARRPERVGVRAALAQARAARGDVAGARAVLADAGARGHRVELRIAAAAVHADAGDAAAARRALLEVLDDEPDAHGALARLASLIGDADTAAAVIARLDAAVARHGSAGAGVEALADLLVQWRPTAEALGALGALRARWPRVWAVWRHEVALQLVAGAHDAADALCAAAVGAHAHEPGAWLAWASVHAARGAHAAQVEAAERAVALAPGAAEPVRALARACLAAGDRARARALAERAAALEPWHPLSHAAHAAVLDQLGDRAAAAAAARRAVELDPEWPVAWSLLVTYAGASDAVAAARDVVARRPRAVEPRLVLERHDATLGLERRLALLDEVVAIAPALAAAHDRRAELLARARRWDEALAACRPAAWGEAPPVELRGRAAWVRRRRGEDDDQEEAVDELIAAIAGHPRYDWGVHEVMRWAAEDQATLAYAKRVAAAAPGSALAQAWLGEAQREVRAFDQAEASFRRALALDAREQLARLGLFDTLAARGRLGEAAPLLDGLDEDNPWVKSRQVHLAAATGRAAEAATTLGALLRIDDAAAPIDEAITSMEQHRAADVAYRALSDALVEPGATTAVGQVWWHRVGSRRLRSFRLERIAMMGESSAGRWCSQTYLAEVRHLGVQSFVGQLLGSYRALRRTGALWSATARALFDAGLVRLARWWTRDWDRRDVPGWALQIAALARVATGRGGGGGRRRGRARPPPAARGAGRARGRGGGRGGRGADAGRARPPGGPVPARRRGAGDRVPCRRGAARGAAARAVPRAGARARGELPRGRARSGGQGSAARGAGAPRRRARAPGQLVVVVDAALTPARGGGDARARARGAPSRRARARSAPSRRARVTSLLDRLRVQRHRRRDALARDRVVDAETLEVLHRVVLERAELVAPAPREQLLSVALDQDEAVEIAAVRSEEERLEALDLLLRDRLLIDGHRRREALERAPLLARHRTIPTDHECMIRHVVPLCP